MRLSGTHQIAEQKIRAYRRTDPAAAAAYSLRFFAVCPMCGETMRMPQENVVTSMRTLLCHGCQWSAQITEAQWRSAPEYGLKPVCELALAEKEAREATVRATLARRSPESGRSSRWGPAPREATEAPAEGPRGAHEYPAGEMRQGRAGRKGARGGSGEPPTD